MSGFKTAVLLISTTDLLGFWGPHPAVSCTAQSALGQAERSSLLAETTFPSRQQFVATCLPTRVCTSMGVLVHPPHTLLFYTSLIPLHRAPSLGGQGAKAAHTQGTVRPVTHPVGDTPDRPGRGIFFRQTHACYGVLNQGASRSKSLCTGRRQTPAEDWHCTGTLRLLPLSPWAAHIWPDKMLSIFSW